MAGNRAFQSVWFKEFPWLHYLDDTDVVYVIDKIWCSYRIWQVRSKITNSLMTSLLSYDAIFCFRLPYPLKFEIFYLLTDLAEIWLRGRILGDDFESEMIFYIRLRGLQALLNNRTAMATIQVTEELSLYVWMLYT